ncbi:low affinity iron permease family protein [Mycobacterium sp. SMC-21]|uniref:low affinity iron permease family protein n=1 Tax=Mycobacterium sp. SMC-21 TaxID=3381632 RepID=UPI003877074A
MTASDNADADVMPSGVSGKVSMFDRFATNTAEIVSRAWFFLACVLLVVLWAPTFAFMTVDTWQLVINTITTIITFLLVALLQNTERRAGDALQHKLNAIADALADVMHHMGNENEGLRDDEKELREAVGLEERESTG